MTAPPTLEAGARRALRRSWLVVHVTAAAIMALGAETVITGGRRFSTPGAIALLSTAALMWVLLSLGMRLASRSYLRAARRADTVVDVAGRRLANDVDAERGNWT